ncbi:hypothetical protein AKJ16_DCAP17753 [Drosera capensis]
MGRRKSQPSNCISGNASRDWAQIYSIYGLDAPTTLLFLLVVHALLLFVLSLLLLLHSPTLPFHPPRPLAAILAALSAISSLILLLAAANILYSSVGLRWEMSQRMLGAVADWGSVRRALDVGCGRGMLLCAVALRLKKEGGCGRVVGVDGGKGGALRTLKTAGIEGVQEYVTCREGDVRRLPFNDGYFDVVVSGAFLHRVGKELGQKTAAAAAERVRVLGELVRVLKPGGIGVVWDLVHVPEYVKQLQELKMEDIRVSERITAYLTSSHIVSFRKPSQHVAGPVDEVRLDWRSNNLSLC